MRVLRSKLRSQTFLDLLKKPWFCDGFLKKTSIAWRFSDYGPDHLMFDGWQERRTLGRKVNLVVARLRLRLRTRD